MKILGIETSGTICGASIIDAKNILSQKDIKCNLNHSEKIFDIVEYVFKKSRVELKDLNGISVDIGPGSFTGIRVGVSIARAFGQGLKIKLAGICGIDALISQVTKRQTIDLICPIINASENYVYTAEYSNGLTKKTPYMLIEIKKLLENLSSRNLKVIFVGDGILNYDNLIKKILGHAGIILYKNIYISSESIAKIGLEIFEKGKGKDYNYIKPFYIKKCSAEK